ncbi:MAG: nucleotidyltransferase domain-containing protein [Pasteurella sp.]|nr:nucleotidyltransferase domain-containing protein [Pasteurella sp.]
MKIQDKYKQAIIEIARNTITEPCEILAFGSRVNGDSHDGSDLDLVIISKRQNPIDYDMFLNFKNSLQESNVPILVQVMDWYAIPESFRQNIARKNERLVII